MTPIRQFELTREEKQKNLLDLTLSAGRNSSNYKNIINPQGETVKSDKILFIHDEKQYNP